MDGADCAVYQVALGAWGVGVLVGTATPPPTSFSSSGASGAGAEVETRAWVREFVCMLGLLVLAVVHTTRRTRPIQAATMPARNCQVLQVRGVLAPRKDPDVRPEISALTNQS